MFKLKSLIVDPRELKDSFKRELLRVISNRLGIRLKFVPVAVSGVHRGFRRGYYVLEIREEKEKFVKKILKRFNINLIKDANNALGLFDETLIYYMETNELGNTPIGVSENFDRLVLIQLPNKIIVRDPLSAIYLSLLSEKSLWVGTLFKGYENFFELIDSLPISSIPREKLIDLSEYLSYRFLSKKEVASVIEKLISGSESMLEDLELPLGSEVDRLLNEIFSWGVLTREGEIGEGCYILSTKNLSKVAIDVVTLVSILMGFKIIVVTSPNLDRRVLDYITEEQTVIIVDSHGELSEPFRVLIDGDKGELVKKFYVSGKELYRVEKFMPIWKVFREDIW